MTSQKIMLQQNFMIKFAKMRIFDIHCSISSIPLWRNAEFGTFWVCFCRASGSDVKNKSLDQFLTTCSVFSYVGQCKSIVCAADSLFKQSPVLSWKCCLHSYILLIWKKMTTIMCLSNTLSHFWFEKIPRSWEFMHNWSPMARATKPRSVSCTIKDEVTFYIMN